MGKIVCSGMLFFLTMRDHSLTCRFHSEFHVSDQYYSYHLLPNLEVMVTNDSRYADQLFMISRGRHVPKGMEAVTRIRDGSSSVAFGVLAFWLGVLPLWLFSFVSLEVFPLTV